MSAVSSWSELASTKSLATGDPPVRDTASSRARAHSWSTSTAATAAPGSSSPASACSTSAGRLAERALGGPAAPGGVEPEVEQRAHDPAGVAVQSHGHQLAGGGVPLHEQHVEDAQRASALDPLESADEPALEVRVRAESVDE